MLQVEIDGEVLGKGIGLTWDEAKMQVIFLLVQFGVPFIVPSLFEM